MTNYGYSVCIMPILYVLCQFCMYYANSVCIMPILYVLCQFCMYYANSVCIMLIMLDIILWYY